MIGIIDYGMGNLRSVQKAFETLGYDARIITRPCEVLSSSKLVLPGVGAFRDAARNLRDNDLIDPILEFIAKGRPFLGICLGLQLLFDISYEDGEHTGLGLISGKVKPFDPGEIGYKLKIPHMGWNSIFWDDPIPIFADIPQGAYVYFVHSYYVEPIDSSTKRARTEYGLWFTSAIWKDNIYAVQFHPEKSQKIGLKILANFAKLD